MSQEIINKIKANLEYQKQFGELVFIDKQFKINDEEVSLKKQINPEIREKEISYNSKINNSDKVSIDLDWQKSNSLPELNSKIHNCLECPLGETRKSFVFGSGNPNSKILIIGEAPGADEDEQGLPFIGRAGQLLTKIIEAINFNRDDLYIANIIKCRPPGNRRPTSNEVEKCEPYLKKQIEIINPEFILALGLTAVNTLLKGDFKMKDVRGKVLEYEGKKLLITYHPAALLRNPSWKKQTWEDVKILRSMYDEYMEKNNGI
jgi:DNA polymerase